MEENLFHNFNDSNKTQARFEIPFFSLIALHLHKHGDHIVCVPDNPSPSLNTYNSSMQILAPCRVEIPSQGSHNHSSKTSTW